eukprot:TRINITY_DN28449_c0_g1_i1.p1 TRINITY_DN28449_c0_g1~~TRINITY_DN28449_c0_g1_i1.p1  ORF type:complete len:522 (+),score=107.20 TRINITY_DN28449_c0_g1_i1:148-1713(+)
MDLQSNPVNEILYITFNQDFTCFLCGTENGFRVYSTEPFRLTHRTDFDHGGGLGVVAMLFRTNILALSGGGANPRFQPTKVMLWDDRTARVAAELSFRSPVRSIKMRRDVVVVVLAQKVYLYGLRNLQRLNSIETAPNPKGLCCLSSDGPSAVLACPGMQQGRVMVLTLPSLPTVPKGDPSGDLTAPTVVDPQRTTVIAAHDTHIAALGSDSTGSILATASDKGTIIRIFDARTGARLQELRRGADRAEIHSLAFGLHASWLAVASDKGTVHIFSVKRTDGGALPSLRSSGSSPAFGGLLLDPNLPLGASIASAASATSAASVDTKTTTEGGYPTLPPPQNSKSSLLRFSGLLPAYFSSEWSFAQFRVPDYRCIAAFGATDPYTVVVICANGSFYRARFDSTRGGEMTREEFAQFDDASIAASRAPSAAFVGADASASGALDSRAIGGGGATGAWVGEEAPELGGEGPLASALGEGGQSAGGGAAASADIGGGVGVAGADLGLRASDDARAEEATTSPGEP